MIKLNKDIIFVFLLVILLWWIMKPINHETFSSETNGEHAYGLRGEKLRTSDISHLFIRPDRQVVLNHAGGEMWISDFTPTSEGIKNCRKVPCPTHHGGYDNIDTCWTCGSSCPKKTFIPYIHPHVKN